MSVNDKYFETNKATWNKKVKVQLLAIIFAIFGYYFLGFFMLM